MTPRRAVLPFVLAASVAVAVDEPPPVSAASFASPDTQLESLIDALLAGNPEIAAARHHARGAGERIAQARALPDPQVSYRYFADTPETRVGPQRQMLEINQGIPWFDKRELQAERTATLARSLETSVEQVQRSLVAELKGVYFEIAYLQEALAINAEELELLRRFEDIALKRYATGQGIQQSVIKVQTDISRLHDRETELRERLAIATRRIAELIGRPETTPVLGPITLDIPAGAPAAGDLLQEATVEYNPGLRASALRIEADRLWSRRRRLENRPDFRFGVGYTEVDPRSDRAGILNPPEDNGKDVVALSVGINIPLYRKRNRAGVAEAEESIRSGERRLEAERNRLRFQVRQAVARLDSAAERARLHRDAIIPQAEEALASAEAAYATNRQGFLDLLDAERILFQTRLAHRRLISDFWMAAAEIEAALARPFPGRSEP